MSMEVSFTKGRKKKDRVPIEFRNKILRKSGED